MSKGILSPVDTFPSWVNGRHRVRCVKVVQETWDICTFWFIANSPTLFRFKPGQFVNLELEIEGDIIMRSYTIASSPSRPNSFAISVKRVSQGLVSNWLHDHLREGDEIFVQGPMGGFNCADYPADKVLLLSGGIGVTPLMSMLRWWFDTHSDVDISFIHSAKQPKDIVFPKELELIDSCTSNFHLALVCERSEAGESWGGFRGRLNEDLLRVIAPDFMEREIFCCGPTPYMEAVKVLLKTHDFPMQRYHEEHFGGWATSESTTTVEEPVDTETLKGGGSSEAQAYSVRFSKTGKSTKVSPNETVYEAASKLGLHIPKACGMGICGTCKVHIAHGELNQEHNGGITEADIAEGYALSCCSRPLSDIEVDY